jgi:hypothetical protein
MKDRIPMLQMDTRKYRTTLRLTFRYDGERIVLANQERGEGIAPPAPVLPPVEGENSGFWVEVRDARDRVLFYRVLHNPIPYVVEAYAPEGEIHAVAGLPGPVQFEVLVPDISEAASIVLYSSPLELEHSLEPAREIARFPLKEERSQRRSGHERQ